MFIEAIEDLDKGILESLDAQGCTFFQKIKYGIFPQLLPSFASTLIYRFDMEALSQEKKYSLLYDFAAETGQTQKKQILFQWANEEKNEILLVQSDITDVWKDEQERLHRSEEMTALQNTVANVPVGIAVITLQENGFSLVVKNDQIRQLFGNAPLDEKQFLRNIHPDDVAQVQTAITRSYVSDKPVILEFRFHQQADALFRWYRLKANVVDRGEGEKLAYCCLSDIM